MKKENRQKSANSADSANTGKTGPTQPMRNKEDVPASNDEHIDEDFPGYPHHPAKENIVNPRTRKDKKAANTDKNSSDQDNGSAGAFEATENPRE